MLKLSNERKYISGKIVLPGEKLCVVEEFTPGEGTYEDNGEVFSKVAGRVLYDFVAKRVIVIPLKKNKQPPKPNMTVYAVVTSVKEDTAFLKIFADDKRRLYTGPFTGVLHVSQVSTNFIKTISDAVKIGDVVKAKVLTNSSPFQLTTKGARLGVVYAQCSRCGAVLIRKNTKLICPKCGNVEQRKVSIEYMFK